ncbi:MAG TPA: hypothetical protein DEF43_11500 [Chloroflexus aurantiacus]|uniref:Uncharacterized protein n=1 Tax=Chloroflexus aurantiacus (strain ATCC 29366 / DSM 635 / J-10-fl) TaxID=324602 RepID=A9WBQ5_CHLAA|nr:hypothetical protein [Chloroflexus aurantiacus]ABY34862.1 hypothetical protein Caur_1644 [Chloroflexus aurantiacus J-10-fl]RMG48869.1 MAG: hypothetical protein D6716_12420 [Chloroflexota bacterium]GIV92794.1 MAG: hypothetical protein KatS3mg056_1503 [Chloroflexus sp.]HBW67762.1 hypothetical protein [Chloroflexus aurantiacus]
MQRRYWLIVSTICLLSGLLWLTWQPSLTVIANGGHRQYIPIIVKPSIFTETFTGEPAQPQSWDPNHWDVAVHSRDVNTWYQLEEMSAEHGHDCAPAPATHTINRYEDAVYQCRNHIMTAIKASGYGLIYLTPNHLVDFSGGTATIRFDVSTLRTSLRDWIDLWISPYNDHLQLPFDMEVDLSGPPRNGVQVRMDLSGNFFDVIVYRNFQPTVIQGVAIPYERFLEPSATRRDTFELQISRTRIRFGMPAYNFYWVDTSIADLGWDQGVVQFGHHSYNPLKDCTSSCRPGTWHWDNVTISPSRPFTMIAANRRYADRANPSVTLAAPAPANAYLRFSGIGPNLQVRFNGGAWQPARLQAQDSRYFKDEHFRNFWMPIPAGVTQIEFRGDRWWGADWHVRGISVWALP